MKKFDLYPFRLLSVVCWVYLISALSGQPGADSAHQSQFFCDSMASALSWTGCTVPLQACHLISQVLVRKTAHITEYCILAVLLFSCLKPLFSFRKSLAWAFGMGVLLAGLDEFHQSFIPGRGCQLMDVLIDTAGITTGLLICLLFRKKQS